MTTEQEKTIQQIKDFIAKATLRNGGNSVAKVKAIQKDTFGNPTSLIGTVTTPNEGGEPTVQEAMWYPNGVLIGTPQAIFDLVEVEELG